MEIIAFGRITITNSEFYARGGDGQTGIPGAQGIPGSSGSQGQPGNIGESGGIFSGSGGDGGRGGDGGLGGSGGTGGQGGIGGGGAGGTIKFYGSVIYTDDAFVNTEGGEGSNPGEVGRLIVGKNAGRYEYYNKVSIGLKKYIYLPTYVADLEQFSGPIILNPFIYGNNTFTPYIPDLSGGSAGFGFLEISAQELFSSEFFDQAPDDAVMAVIRLDGGIPGLIESFSGYDLVLFTNLTENVMKNPKLGMGKLGFQVDLIQAGFLTDELFGGEGSFEIDEFAPFEVYATLIPEDTQFFTASASLDGVNYLGKALSLSDGDTMFIRPPGLVTTINQQNPPEGIDLGGRPWQSLGTINVVEDPTSEEGIKVEVFLNLSEKGIASADGVFLRRIDPQTLPELRFLGLSGNPLDNRAHEIYIPEMEDHGKEVDFEENSSPTLLQIPQKNFTTETIYFNGDDQITIAHNESLELGQTFTLETWFYVSDFSGFWMPVITKSDGVDATTRTLSLWVNSFGFLYFTSADGTSESSVFTPLGSIKTGKWYHFAGVVDRINGHIEAYLN